MPFSTQYSQHRTLGLHADQELHFFGQEIFELAEDTSGDLTDPDYMEQRATATTSARAAIDDAIAANDLDAIVAPTNNAAWLTDLENGDDFTDFVSSSSPASSSRVFWPTVLD